MEKTQAIVRRFDEVVTEKANKLDLHALELSLQNYLKLSDFTEQVRMMNHKVKDSVDRCIAVENMLDDMGRNISKDIYAAVRRATSNVVKGEGGGVRASHQTNMEVLPAAEGVPASENVKHLIGLKADQTEVEKLSAIKANKVDTDLCLKWLELIQKQMKQTLMLIIETLKCLVEQTDDNTT
jgi:hypothetical protein